MASEAAVAGHAPAEAHVEPNYIAIFIYLAVLTGIELLVYAAGFPQIVKVSLLIALAWAKAVLVAMYFMHLSTERPGLWIIALTPVVLVTFLCLMLLPDLTTRLWTHYDHRIKVTNPALEGANPTAPPPAANP